MIRIGIMGYGNLGRGVEYAVAQNPDMQLAAVFTRRDPASIQAATPDVPVLAAGKAAEMQDKIDVMILCGGSATDLPKQTPALARLFNVVDSFDTHANIPRHFEAVDKAAKEGNPHAMEFPRAKVGGSAYDFSFSGMKSAVLNYINQAQQYKAYGIDMGYDTDKSPAEQTYNEEEGTTYADYFLDQALTQLQRTAILCEEASKEGYTLSADGEKAVQDNMTALYTYSVQSGAGSEEAYLRAIYGSKMSKSLFKDLLTQAILADEYATHKSETFTYTDEQLNKYYNENKNDLDSYEYRYCYVNADFPEQKTDADGNTVDLTDEQKQTAMDGAKTKADSMLAAVQAGTAFNTAAQDVLDETSAESYSDPEYNHKNDLGSALTSTYQSWLTDGSRKAGDITSIEVADTGYCVVQFLGRKKDDNSYQTLTYRNIEVLAETTPSEDENGTDLPTDEQLAAAKTKADDLLDQWKNGDATADSFGELAKTNSADETNKDNGGLNEDANRSSLDANLTDWLFAEGRQPGDAAVVEASDSSGNVIGYQILYVESLGEIQWKYQATTALRSDDYDKWYTEVEANYPAELTDLGKEIAASSSNQ